MPPLIDLTGRELAGWKVVEATAARSKGGDVVWLCECLTCGSRKGVRGNHLRGETTHGCGHCRGVRAMARSDRSPKMREHKRSLTRHVWAGVCELCRDPFAGTAKQRYCSKSCREKAQYRRDCGTA